jgi:hypothetical protein
LLGFSVVAVVRVWFRLITASLLALTVLFGWGSSVGAWSTGAGGHSNWGSTTWGDTSADGDFDKALATCTTFAGTQAMLIDFVSEHAEIGIDPLVLGFEWGDLDADSADRLAQSMGTAFGVAN